MADLAVVELPRNGVSLDDIIANSMVAADVAGDKFINDGKTVLFVYNGDVSPITVTVTSQPDDLARTGDESMAVGADEVSLSGPFLPRGWSVVSGADKGKVLVTYSAVTSVKVLALRITNG